MSDGQVAWSLAEVEALPSAVTLGYFDGVHTGHVATVRRAVDAARAADLRAVAMTFDPHPVAVLRGPEMAPPLLCTPEERAELLLATGVDLVVVLPFDAARAAQPAQAFEREVLVETFDARHVVIGENFTYGHRAAGTATTLQAWGRDEGAIVDVVELVTAEDGWTVSSTALRMRLAEHGDVAWAAQALGRPFALGGTVVEGDRRGRTIGFPTANIEVGPRMVVPANGVYAGWALLGDDERRPMVTNIGNRPTFDGRGTTVEVHLLDGGRDLYGEQLTAELHHRLRAEQRFDGPDELVEQIGRDVARARELLDLA